MEDYAKIKGLEFKLKLNNFSNLTGDIDYTWMSAKGTGSSNREYYYLYIFDSDRPLPVKEYPMEFDLTHSLKFNLNYYLPKTNNSSFTGDLLSDWNFNFQGNLASGAPYTPTDIYGKAQEIGSKRMPGYKSLDIGIYILVHFRILRKLNKITIVCINCSFIRSVKINTQSRA